LSSLTLSVGSRLGKLLQSNIHQLITYANEGLVYILPAILGVVITFELGIMLVLMLSIYDAKKGHILRMATLVFLAVLTATSLTASVALTDAFVYLRTDLEGSKEVIIKIATHKLPCKGSKLPNITHSHDCLASDPAEDGCYYPDSMVVASLLPIGLPGEDRYDVNITAPLAENIDPTPACVIKCAAGPHLNDWLEPKICHLQDSVTNLLEHTITKYTAVTSAFAYGILLVTIMVIVVVEVTNPSRQFIKSEFNAKARLQGQQHSERLLDVSKM
jgi:hypothetical protein